MFEVVLIEIHFGAQSAVYLRSESSEGKLKDQITFFPAFPSYPGGLKMREKSKLLDVRKKQTFLFKKINVKTEIKKNTAKNANSK